MVATAALTLGHSRFSFVRNASLLINYQYNLGCSYIFKCLVVESTSVVCGVLVQNTSILLLSGSQSRVGKLSQLQFMKVSGIALSNICKNILVKCPLNSPMVRNMTCLDPNRTYSEPDVCLWRMKGLIQRFVLDKQLSSLTAVNNL